MGRGTVAKKKIWRKIDETILPYLPSRLMSQLIFKAYASQRQGRNVSFLPNLLILWQLRPKQINKGKNLDLYEESSVHV
jgi:hypothetical protein